MVSWSPNPSCWCPILNVQVRSSGPGESFIKCSGLHLWVFSKQHRQHPGSPTSKDPPAQQNTVTPGRNSSPRCKVHTFWVLLCKTTCCPVFALSLQGWLAPRLTPLLRRRSLTCCQTWAETFLLLRQLKLPLLPTLPILHIFQASQVSNVFTEMKLWTLLFFCFHHHSFPFHCFFSVWMFPYVLFPSCSAPQGNSSTNFANFEAFGNTTVPSNLSTSPPSKSFSSGTIFLTISSLHFTHTCSPHQCFIYFLTTVLMGLVCSVLWDVGLRFSIDPSPETLGI